MQAALVKQIQENIFSFLFYFPLFDLLIFLIVQKKRNRLLSAESAVFSAAGSLKKTIFCEIVCSLKT
jgi:hypothetical protein